MATSHENIAASPIESPSSQFQKILAEAQKIKNLPSGYTVGPNFIEVDNTPLLEKIARVTNSKKIAIVIGPDGVLHFGRRVYGDSSLEKVAIQAGIKAGEGKMSKIGDIYLIGKVQVETFLDPASRESVMNSISREIHDTKISEDMKSQAKARAQAETIQKSFAK